jgi:hypothetical protein
LEIDLETIRPVVFGERMGPGGVGYMIAADGGAPAGA